MSDRSGVGAPTHDGADPDPTGPDAASETETTRASPSSNGGGSSGDSGSSDNGGSAVTKVKRRLGRDLFGVSLGAEPPAENSPPGVPTVTHRGRETTTTDLATPTDRTAKADRTAKPTAKADDAATASTANGSAAGTATESRRRLTTRDAVTSDPSDLDRSVPVADEPAIIDSSMDSGVVAVVQPEEPRRGRRTGLRARRVHRVIRRVDPWSVLKLALLFYFCVWLMVVVSGVLIWGVAVSSGTVDSLEGFIERLLSFEEFTFNADQIFRLFAMGGLIMVFLATAVSAILAVLFNLISDLIGGIRITVIEEESTRRIVSSD